MHNYLKLLEDVYTNGLEVEGRNGHPVRKVFDRVLRFNLQEGFPAITTKKLQFQSVVAELLWFLGMRHRADNGKLVELGSNIWTANAEANYWTPKAEFPGDLGRIYGVQWRTWLKQDGTTVDQIARLIHSIKTDPHGRRHVVSAWNPGELHDMALPPCHIFFQCFVGDGTLSLKMYQRSADMFLGIPFNIASYAILLHMLAQLTKLKPHMLTIDIGDAHIYMKHEAAVLRQLSRAPKTLPSLALNAAVWDIDAFTMNDVQLVNYDPAPGIKAEMLV